MEKIFDAIGQIGNEIKNIYQSLLENFYHHNNYRSIWEGLLQGQISQNELLNRFREIMPTMDVQSLGTVGGDVNYEEILAAIEGYKRDLKDEVDINSALKMAFHLELLEIQGIFNELIKLPQEPYFDILSELHLETRRNMSRLVDAIEQYCTDQEFLYRVLEIKGGIIEKRRGMDRRVRCENFDGTERRATERRQGKLVKIVCKI